MTFVDDSGNELNYDGEFAISRQSVSVFNFTIKGDVSINFSIDNNSKNRKVLGYYGINMLTQVAFSRQAFNRVKNGNIIDRGYIVIQTDEGDKLNCFYVTGNSNWMQQLKGVVTELNWDKFLVQMSSDNIVTNLISAKEGIVFPWVDWAYNFKHAEPTKYLYDFSNGLRDVSQDQRKTTFQDFYPCVYFHTVISEILNQNNIKLQGNITTDSFYKSLIVTPYSPEMKRTNTHDVTAIGGLTVTDGTAIEVYEAYTLVNDPFGFFQPMRIVYPGDTGSDYKFIPKKSCSVRITITLTQTESPVNNIPIYAHVVGGHFHWFSTLNGAAVGASETSDPLTIDIEAGQYLQIELRLASPGEDIAFNVLIQQPEIIAVDDFVDPSNFLQKTAGVDWIKALVCYFGASVYFDEVSRVMTINCIDKLRKEDAEDWSQYYISHKFDYSKGSNKNYQRLGSNNDFNIRKYNAINRKGYGEGVIETGNEITDEKDLFKIPFSASDFSLDYSGLYVTSVPLINLEDSGDPIPYTAVANNGGYAQFTSSAVFSENEIVRLVDANNVNLGYVKCFNSTLSKTFMLYNSGLTSTGNVYKQTIQYNSITPRLLINRNITFASFASTVGGLFPDNKNGTKAIVEFSSSHNITNIPWAWFAKTKTGELIDLLRYNCAFDNPQGIEDPTVNEQYFSKIANAIGNPLVKCKMRLPESVFKNYKFDKFIYLSCENLKGYFFVDNILNYQDSTKEVEVNLLMI